MKIRSPQHIIWFPRLLNKIVVYMLTMTFFMVLFYLFSGSQQFADMTVNGIIEIVLLFSGSSFFFSGFAILGTIFRNRRVSHLKKKGVLFLSVSMVVSLVIFLMFSFLIVLQTGYGYN